jgi:hypothetical protein
MNEPKIELAFLGKFKYFWDSLSDQEKRDFSKIVIYILRKSEKELAEEDITK